MVPPPGYLQGVREVCHRHGTVLIADDVMSGFGRTGTWFAIEHAEVVPDLLTFAKGVNSGYVPLGGVAISDAIDQIFADRAYPGGLTYATLVEAQEALLDLGQLAHRSAGASCRNSGAGSRRILVVDDNEDIRGLLVRMIQRLGHSAQSAADGVEAVELLTADLLDEG